MNESKKEDIQMTPELKLFFQRLECFKYRLFEAVQANPQIKYLYDELDELFLNENKDEK